MKKINIAKEGLVGTIIKDDLELNREMIDLIDERMMQLLEERMKCSIKIGKIKKKRGLAVIDKKREEKIMAVRTKKTKLDKRFVKDLFGLIFKQSKKLQK